MTDQNFAARIRDALRKSSYWNERTRDNGKTTQNLVCPVCGDRSAWAYTDNPMSINCNRSNQCGVRTKTLGLFPELRLNVEKDFPATKTDPHRPAREYLKARGLPAAILDGLPFQFQANVRNTGNGAVMFPIGTDAKGKEISNGRLFNPPAGQGKTHNQGSTTGQFWRHHGYQYDPSKPTFITEGILDALSLLALGQQAIAVLAAGQDPGKVDLSVFPHKVLAFDNDDAGRKACRKWRQNYPAAEVILCDQGQDWNDLLTSGNIEQAKDFFIKSLPRYRNNGTLALAETPQEWATAFYNFNQHPPGLFEFSRETFFATLKRARGDNGESFVSVERCLRATARVLSFTIDRANPAKPEYLYNLEIQPSQKGRRPATVTATGRDIATPRAFNEFLLSGAKLPWEGDSKALTAMQAKITGDKKAPEVCRLTVIGYQPESRAYVFHHWAADHNGRIIHPNAQGHFQLSHNRFYQPPPHSDSKAIAPTTIDKEKAKTIYRLIEEAWGMNGLSALSWVVASFFVNQIKEKYNFFPFLSLYGDPASGKSALVTLLNCLQGRDGEGLPITQLNSKKGSVRTIGQVSGLFTALLEDNERNERGFDYSIILTAYNRGPLQVQAAFSNDLQTRENPFLGTLLFAQNTEPFTSKAEKQRTISLYFKAEAITDDSRTAHDRLIAMSKGEIAGVMQQILANRTHFESSWQEEFEKARVDLGGVGERRIIDNHALVLCFSRLFCTLFSIKTKQETVMFLTAIGRQKCISSAVRQTTIADHFFELLDSIEDKSAGCYHLDAERGLVLVYLPRVESILRNKGLNFQASDALTTALQKHPSYVKNGYPYRFPGDPERDNEGRVKRRRVWAFSLEWHQKNSYSTDDHANNPPDSQIWAQWAQLGTQLGTA